LDDSNYEDLGAFGFKRKDSAKRYTQRSDVLFKILLFFGVIFLISSIILMMLSMFSSGTETDYSSVSNSVFSISIIILAFAVILYFFKRQFAKLAEIAEEIENGTECLDEEIQ
jgi:uncharacterized membrane protein (DUF373 family)